MAAKDKKSITYAVWQFFVSVKLTLALLMSLSAVCLIGTLIPQNESPEHYLKLYSESICRLFASLGFLDLFHTWWFIALMSLFTINLIACSLNRLPRVWRIIFHSQDILDERLSQSLSHVKKFSLKKFTGAQEQRFVEILGGYLKTPKLIRQPGEWHFISETGRHTRLGSYLTHLGLLVIILGAITGLLGFQGYMQLVEGETSNRVHVKNSDATRELDFSIRCDRFEVTYYGDSRMPKEYQSDLVVIDSGKEVLRKVIEVNDPLIYRGIYFYQSSYGTASGKNGEVLLKIIHRDSGKQETLRIKVGNTVPLGDANYAVRVDEFLPDFSMDSDGKAFSRSSQTNNPAARVTVLREGKELSSAWSFAKFPEFHKKEGQQLDIQLANFYPKLYTGLQVTRDPGVWVVWMGCMFLVLGIYVAFFTSHRRIWLSVAATDGEFKAVLAGSANKNQAQFSSEFEALFKNLKA